VRSAWWAHWVAHRRQSLPVSEGPHGIAARRPRLLRSGSSSRERYLSYRVLRSEPAPRLSAPSPFLGVRPPSRRQPVESTSRGHPEPATFRPRGFSPPRRFPPPPTLRVYFTPQPRPGFALQGVPLRCSRTISSMARALLSLDRVPCRRLAPSAPRTRSPPSGPCSASESVASLGGLIRAPPDSLLGFASSGCSVSSPCPRLHGGSARGLGRETVHARFRVRPAACCRREARHASLEARRPARGFRPEHLRPKP